LLSLFYTLVTFLAHLSLLIGSKPKHSKKYFNIVARPLSWTREHNNNSSFLRVRFLLLYLLFDFDTILSYGVPSFHFISIFTGLVGSG